MHVRLLNVVSPFILEVEPLAPVNATVPVPPLKAPAALEFVQSPETLMLVAVPAVRLVPDPSVSVLRFNVVVEPPIVRALVLAVVILLNVWAAAVPFMFCAPALLNVTVPEPGVNVPPLFVQLPAALILLPLALRVPEAAVKLPPTVKVSERV